MNIHAKTFTEHGKKYVRIPAVEYQRILELLEDIEDAGDVAKAKALMAGGEETLPADFAYQLMDAKNPGERIALWRKYRKMTQAQLAKKIDTDSQYISMIESGKRKGSARMKDLAKALGCVVDDLL